jgi:hypothetical protein
MTARFHRWLLLLFAVIAMTISMPNANSVEHAHLDCTGMAESGDASVPPDEHAIHATGCCAAVVPMPAESTAGFHGGSIDRFSLHAADMAPTSHLRSKHYRPPRPV